MNNKTFSILTLGCRVNQYEADCISEVLLERGFEQVPFGTGADIAIVNTCTVTSESDRKSRQMIRRAVSASNGGHVIVTGCFAETGRSTVDSISGVSYITGNGKKSEIPNVIDKLMAGQTVPSDNTDISEAAFDVMSLKTPQRTRSYIKIEDGCDSKCAYCIIPKARGSVRSKPYDVIIEEGRALYEAGCREVILTGIETAAYGKDFAKEPFYGYSLAKVINGIADIGYERIGLGSLDPTVMNDGFVSAISNIPSLMPHFHLSVQSGCTTVLNRMRRRYNAKMLEECIGRLKAAIPDVTLSADIITGFPGETDEEFAETLEFIRKTEFLHLHIFPYSIREGTAAATMKDQIPGDVKSARLHTLYEEQEKIKKALCEAYVASHKASPVSVLVEKVTEGIAYGHSEHFAEIEFSGSECLVGKTVKVVLTDTDGEICKGNIL